MKSSSFIKLAFALTGTALATAGIQRRLRRICFKDASVVITGGSRGLGLELARLFAAEGSRLALLARDGDELERAASELNSQGADVLTLTCDVGNQEAVEHAIASIIRERGRIDVLINNAGIIQVAPFENLDFQDFQNAMNIHAWGPLYLIKAVAPQMKEQGGGRIVNISSIGGLVAVPHMLPYCMSKFALTALSDGLRAELSRDGIRVTTVAPGLMRTGSHVNASFKGQFKKEFAWFSISGTNPLFSASSSQAARQILNACRYGDARLIISLPAALLHTMNANFPAITSAITRLAARLLPGPVPSGNNTLRTGNESRSAASPSILTKLGDLASRRNNEV